MFFYASKILWFFATPTNVVVLLAIAAAACFLIKRPRLGRRLAVLAALVLILIGISPLPKLVMRPLEDRFPIADPNRPIDGIVVLGGAVGITRGQVTFNDAASRMTTGIDLALHHPQARLVFTGGDAGFFVREEVTEAEAADRLFRAVGIDPSRIVLEDRARNTRENALFTRALIAPKAGERWVLVTSAFHMPRAVATFRAAGLDLEPYPVDFRTDGDGRDIWRPFNRFADAMRMMDLAVREWIGLIAYRLAGYTQVLWPEAKR